ARPEQPLRACAFVGEPLPAVGVEHLTMGLVGALGHRDAEHVVQLVGLRGRLVRRVPAADEDGSDRADEWVQTGVDAPLDAAPLEAANRGGGRRYVLLA